MRQWLKKHKGTLMNLFFAAVVVLSTSFSTENTEAYEIFENKIECLNSKVDSLTVDLETTQCELTNHENLYQEMVDDPIKLAEYVVEKGNLKQLSRETDSFPATKFQFVKPVNGDISKELYAALLDYSMIPSAPDSVGVTSGKRTWTFRSRHYHGDAIDLRANENLQNFLAWIETDEGNDWLERNSLHFYIEDTWHSPFLRPWEETSIDDFIFINRRATGPHVHLEYRG